MVFSGVAVLVGALLVGLVVLMSRGDEDDAAPPSTSLAVSTTATAPPTTAPPTPAELLAAMPAGPLDGRDSWRLPVLVTPQSGVVDGGVVTALGRGFEPGERVGVVMCASEAAVEGVAACELGTDVNHYEFVTYANAGNDGSVVADVVLRRLITTPFSGPVDCQSTAERCLVAIGAVSNYDRSGGSFIGFAGAPPFPTPTLALEPPGPYASGQEVTVLATGLLPTRDVEVLQCLDGACATLFAGTVAADGTFTTVVVLESALADAAGNVLPCADACLLQLTDSRLPGTTSAPLPMPVEQHRLVRALVVRATTSLTKRLPPGKGF